MTISGSTKRLPRVAYYCMEFGLAPELHTYSGGLGILAGDFLKAAREGRYPIVGVGILWQQGYGEQEISATGAVTSAFRSYENDKLEDTGVTVKVKVAGHLVVCKVWKCDAYANAPLYLLDTNLKRNGEHASIGDRLYGGDARHRVAQELVLGVGGLRALRALGLEPDVHHFNEGHAVFAGLEMVREQLARKRAFRDAIQLTRQRIVFTTHTPVPAGNEQHPMALLRKMGVLDGFTPGQARAIGNSPFNMTAAALRLSRCANAVAELHGVIADQMWADLDHAAPIHPITNAIHVKSWVDARILRNAGNATRLWAAHQANKRALIRLVEQRTGVALREDVLLIAFSRRAATYKRWELILSSPKVIEPLLEEGRLQLVFSGKAHPADGGGRAMVERIVGFARRHPDAMAFLPNYDMTIGRALTRGADVWLNSPRRPNEASGTSGMKAAMNGVLNLSTLDGWWPEACAHGVNGWQYGDGREMQPPEKQDAYDRRRLYRVLTEDVLPTYERRPKTWIRMMQASIASTRDRFDAKRMLADYYRTLYTA